MTEALGNPVFGRASHLRFADRVFAILMPLQYIAAIVMALLISPVTFDGAVQSVHPHLMTALVMGGLITFPVTLLVILRPEDENNGYVAAMGQMLMGSLLIHVSGGRIETHFHVFVSLAFLAFYRDWTILLTATIVVATDHFLRGFYLPQSIYGVNSGAGLRVLEHAAWVIFEDFILILSFRCADRQYEKDSGLPRATAPRRIPRQGGRIGEELAMEKVAEARAAMAELLSDPNSALRDHIETLQRDFDALAAIVEGYRAAVEPEVRKELSNGPEKLEEALPVLLKEIPETIQATRNSVSEMRRALTGEEPEPVEEEPARPVDLNKVVERVLTGWKEEWSGLAIFEQKLEERLPKVVVDEDVVGQAFLVVLENALDAARTRHPGGQGRITISSSSNRFREVSVRIQDNGVGMTPEVQARIFEPEFTTKPTKRGPGLASVEETMTLMGAKISVASEPGQGTAVEMQFSRTGKAA